MAILPWRRKEHRRTIGLPAAQSNIDGGLDLDVRFFGNNLTLTPRDTRIITQTGASSGVAIQDVKIAYVVDCSFAGDCDTEELCIWNQIGNHLRTSPLIGFCDLDSTIWLPVLPNCGHSVAEFNQVAWNINDANQPVFTVFREGNVPSPDCSVPVWRMIFGEGEKWTTPPTNLCGTTEPDPDLTGACCDTSNGNCTQTTEADCIAPLEYQGNGTTCTPNTCLGGAATGACCILGVCSILDQAACELDGTYQGDDTTCVPDDPCGAPATGACCFISGSCTEGHTPSSCSFQGGIYQGDGTACGSCGQPEACCLGAGCFEWPVEFCNAAGGVPMGGTCTPDPCGGGAQAPTGRRSGRRV